MWTRTTLPAGARPVFTCGCSAVSSYTGHLPAAREPVRRATAGLPGHSLRARGPGAAAAELWPACTGIRATANLRSAVWRLPGHDQGGLIAASPQRLALDARVSVDLRDLTRQVGPGGAAERPGPGVDVEVLRKDVLPEWPDGWLIGTREWFRQIRLHALDALCDRYRDDGRLDAALDAGITAVAADPLRESAHRRLTLVHIEEGTSPRRCASTTSTADYCAPSSGCLRRSTSASSSRRCSAGPWTGATVRSRCFGALKPPRAVHAGEEHRGRAQAAGRR